MFGRKIFWGMALIHTYGIICTREKLYILRIISVRSTLTIYPSVHNLKMYISLKINISSLH